MMDRKITGQQVKKADTLTRRILAIISIVIFLGLPIYGVDASSD